MNVKIGVSNRHVHLSKEDFEILFKDIEPQRVKDLVQVGQYASNLKVSIKTNKDTITNVRVLLPIRDYTQVEISKTDSYLLGIKPPVRMSGDLNGAEEVTIIGEYGEVTKNVCIIAQRHIHINYDDRKRLGLLNIDKVKVKLGNEKTAILNDVYLKEDPNGVLECHIDTDDANANFVNNGDLADIIIN